jgi:hypothetical protein
MPASRISPATAPAWEPSTPRSSANSSAGREFRQHHPWASPVSEPRNILTAPGWPGKAYSHHCVRYVRSERESAPRIPMVISDEWPVRLTLAQKTRKEAAGGSSRHWNAAEDWIQLTRRTSSLEEDLALIAPCDQSGDELEPTSLLGNASDERLAIVSIPMLAPRFKSSPRQPRFVVRSAWPMMQRGKDAPSVSRASSWTVPMFVMAQS